MQDLRKDQDLWKIRGYSPQLESMIHQDSRRQECVGNDMFVGVTEKQL